MKSSHSAICQTTEKAKLVALYAKEKAYYTSLSALIDFLQGEQKHQHAYKSFESFEDYKRNTLSQTSKLKSLENDKARASENQFNVMYYQRAILCASEANYRNMAILAAMHNLTPIALHQLLTFMKKSCIRLSKEIKKMEKQYQQNNTRLSKRETHAIVIQREHVL